MLDAAQRLIEPATAWLRTGGIVIGRGVTEIAISILIAFFLYRDRVAFGDRFRAAAARIAGPSADPLLDLAINTLHSVVYGILGTAVVQGVVAGIGLLIAGVPGAILLGLLTFFLSIVPMGPPLVWVPATRLAVSERRVGLGAVHADLGLRRLEHRQLPQALADLAGHARCRSS